MDNELVKKIREFNRYYTVWLNVLTKGYLGTDFSWPESRTLFEIWLFPVLTQQNYVSILIWIRVTLAELFLNLKKRTNNKRTCFGK